MGVLLSFIQETKAQNNVEKLLNMVRIVVLRRKALDINVAEIVPRMLSACLPVIWRRLI